MKASKITFIIAAAALLVSAQSCLKDQKDIFEKSSSIRLQEFLTEIENTLVANTNGWEMAYYLGVNQLNGGYTFHLVFDGNGKVTAQSELKPEESATSDFKLTTDNGPVLSFDTNNSILHYFATPSSAKYQARGGDFEFTVLNCSKDKIEMRGKRSGNTYTLTPYSKEESPEEYLTKINVMSKSVKAATLEGQIGDRKVVGNVDLNNRAITFNYLSVYGEEMSVRMPFRFTDDGILGYSPVRIGGCTFQKLYYLAKNNEFTNGVFTLECKVPENYVEYNYFKGKFQLIYNTKTIDITFTPNEDQSGFVMSGLNEHFDVDIQYDMARGILKWYTQPVGSNGNNTITLCAWSTSSGTLTWAPEAGLTISKNVKTGEFEFKDNKEYEDGSFGADSFILWELDADNHSVGEWKGWGTSQYPRLTTIKKIEEE